MTVSAVNKPTTLPREALFRNDLANCQYSFIDTTTDGETKFKISDLKNIKDSIVYAFVIHGPAEDNPFFPSFIRIAFPDQNCRKFIDEPIDLLKKFSDDVEQLMKKGTETIPDKADVKLYIQKRLL
jgi:hypothetical protein